MFHLVPIGIRNVSANILINTADQTEFQLFVLQSSFRDICMYICSAMFNIRTFKEIKTIDIKFIANVEEF